MEQFDYNLLSEILLSFQRLYQNSTLVAYFIYLKLTIDTNKSDLGLINQSNIYVWQIILESFYYELKNNKQISEYGYQNNNLLNTSEKINSGRSLNIHSKESLYQSDKYYIDKYFDIESKTIQVHISIYIFERVNTIINDQIFKMYFKFKPKMAFYLSKISFIKTIHKNLFKSAEKLYRNLTLVNKVYLLISLFNSQPASDKYYNLKQNLITDINNSTEFHSYISMILFNNISSENITKLFNKLYIQWAEYLLHQSGFQKSNENQIPAYGNI